MHSVTKLSVVLPVRDGQGRIAGEVDRILEAIADIVSEAVEMIIVDDGSRDATPEILDELQSRYPQIRIARHHRPLGMEAAGQTGLERATGELVFIQENDQPLRIEDLMKLYRMGSDPTVVAARAESRHGGNKPLLRRLRAWGTRAAAALEEQSETGTQADAAAAGLQMVRRPHLQTLASRAAGQYRLEAASFLASDRDGWFASHLHGAGVPQGK